jgi:V8-like Glu-specific endopeptidase
VSDSDATPGTGQSSVTAPATIEINGRGYIRRDLWSDADLQRMNDEGRWDRPSTDPAVYAAQLRAHMMYQGGYYIEAEPNIEAAKRILSRAEAPTTPPNRGIEGRTVVGSDNRVHTAANTSFPQSAVAFNNSRGSGLRVSRHAIYTAAHVVYDTYGSDTAPVTPANGFFCANGSTSASAPCAPYPSWILGLEGTSGYSGWITPSCYYMTVNGAYVSLTSSGGTDLWTSARWDYASVALNDSCYLGGTSWFGTNVNLALTQGPWSSLGYAEWAPCANNQTGASQADCTGGSWQLSPGPTSSGPFNSARLWLQSGGISVVPGNVEPSNTFTTQGDVTHGNSGGPLYNGPGFALGTCSRQSTSKTNPPNQAQEFNVYHKWTWETYNVFTSTTPFPN